MILEILKERSQSCELCNSKTDLNAHLVSPKIDENNDNCVLLCSNCITEIQKENLNVTHWFCLNESAWTQEAPVQVLVYRLLSQLSEDWSRDLLDQIYLEDKIKEWAELGLNDAVVKVVDSYGTELLEGDTVSLIKSLDVKGGGFTAKQGTIVRGIRLGNDPTHIEGKVNGTSIMLKTEFLKKN